MRWALAVLLALLWLTLISVSEGLAVNGDVIFERHEFEGSGVPVAVFPHWVHRIRYRCNVCHPAIFELKRGADPVTMESMAQGKYCAVCHNGKIAWGIRFDTCDLCHTGPTDGKIKP